MPFDLRLAFLLAALAGCGPARNALHSVTPTAPPDEGPTCPAVPWRCDGNVPMRCTVSDGRARFYPLHPLTPDGRPAPCRRCVVEATAHCAAEVAP